MLKQMPTTIDALVALFKKMADNIIKKQKAELAKQNKILAEAQAKAEAAQLEIDKANTFAENMKAMTENKVVTE